MSDISKISVNGVVYEIKDMIARAVISELQKEGFLKAENSVDNLDSTDGTFPLSAKQGQNLNTNKINNVTIEDSVVSFIGNGEVKCSIILPVSSEDNLTAEQTNHLSKAYAHSQSDQSNAEANLQSDWNITDTNNDAYIKNNPVIPTKAKQIAVEDSENMFEAANVEDVLKELFQYIKRVEEKIESQGEDTEPITYTITNNLTKCSTNNSNTTITKNAEYTATLTANSGYEIKSITVTMGGTDITSSAVTPIIEGSEDPRTYSVTNNLSNCNNSNSIKSIREGDKYNSIITANSGYEIKSVKVTMGGVDIINDVVDGNIIDINIPSVTGNIVITVSASVVSSDEENDEEDTNMIPKMTYGRGINQTTAVIESNPKCWATVNPVTVIVGQTYTISCNAPWVWVYGFDESDNYTSQLVLGTNEVPQNFTFTADTTKIRFGCYDPKKQLTYCTLTKQGSGGSTPIPPIPGVDDDTDHISIVAINPVSISDNYATGEMIPDRGTGITNLTVSKGEAFDILYCTNIPAVKHELSWDNGANYSNQTGSIKVSNSICYKYQHTANNSVNSYNMAIRVTDANGKIDTKSFVITFV